MRIEPIHLRDGQRFVVGKSIDLWLVWDYIGGTVYDYPSHAEAIASIDRLLRHERVVALLDFERILYRPIFSQRELPKIRRPWPWREAVWGSIPWFLHRPNFRCPIVPIVASH
jgi:hypothetical protein